MLRLAVVALAGCSLVTTARTGTGGSAADDPHPNYGTPPGPHSAWTDKPPIHFPIADRPVDPWAGVDGDHPVMFEDEDSEVTSRWEVEKRELACTAARDHCLPPIAWMWVTATRPTEMANVVAFTKYGPRSPNGLRWGHINPDAYVAYRTVPATRANLVPGAIAFAFPDPYPTEVTEVYRDWYYGKVERVDWDLGFVFLAGNGEPRMITGTRVAVLSYDGKQLAIVGGKQRDQLAVSPNDVILPSP
jgi:hypothetical protein